jgi:hypothetical protein
MLRTARHKAADGWLDRMIHTKANSAPCAKAWLDPLGRGSAHPTAGLDLREYGCPDRSGLRWRAPLVRGRANGRHGTGLASGGRAPGAVTVIRLGEIEPRAHARGHGPTPPEGAVTGISDAHRVHLTWRGGKGLTDDTCALMVFSVNGIDGDGPADRGTVVSGIHRVLRLGGMLASSTHLLDDRSAGRRPWGRDWR